MTQALTPRERQAFRYVRGYLLTHGIAPRIRDLADHLGICLQRSSQLIRALAQKGYVTKPRYRWRGISLGTAPSDATTAAAVVDEVLGRAGASWSRDDVMGRADVAELHALRREVWRRLRLERWSYRRIAAHWQRHPRTIHDALTGGAHHG